MADIIFPIVEGHGEVSAVPELLRRLAFEEFGNYRLRVLRPFRLPRGKIVADHELEKAVEFAARKLTEEGGRGGIFILLDADDDRPATLGPALLRRATRHDFSSSVVVARSEYESWFLASANSLRGTNAVRPDASPPANPELIRGAKEYLERELLLPGTKYSETVDQVSLTAAMSFIEARMCPSFDKLYRDMAALLA
jgi:Domain of unknown function (DUF4276)